MRSITKAVVMTGTAAMLLGAAIDSSQARPRRHIQGHSVRAQQHAESRAPGVTKQLFPDSKQSATGGQPGGSPGTE